MIYLSEIDIEKISLYKNKEEISHLLISSYKFEMSKNCFNNIEYSFNIVKSLKEFLVNKKFYILFTTYNVIKNININHNMHHNIYYYNNDNRELKPIKINFNGKQYFMSDYYLIDIITMKKNENIIFMIKKIEKENHIKKFSDLF